MANGNLLNAQQQKEDEYYTQLSDIENELVHYERHFKGKVVLCNCDDPYESNFFKYFAMNFNYLGLKKLICTCYDGSHVAGEQLSIFDDFSGEEKTKKAHKIVITEVTDLNNDGAVNLSDIELLLKNNKNSLIELKGSGDFASEECIDLLKEADIVVTNPPFSLFIPYFDLLRRLNKKFLIIGNKNAITFKNVFPLLQKGEIWLGYNSPQEFITPDGKLTKKVQGLTRWFTNLDIDKRHESLIPYLYKKYSKDEYKKYYNFDGIDCDKIENIPIDYYGCIGVPITIFDKYNPNDFEIVGIGSQIEKTILHQTQGDKIVFIDKKTDEVIYSVPYSVPERKAGNSLRIDENGKPGKIPYGRILIRRKI